MKDLLEKREVQVVLLIVASLTVLWWVGVL
jgi:hypothetical protein